MDFEFKMPAGWQVRKVAIGEIVWFQFWMVDNPMVDFKLSEEALEKMDTPQLISLVRRQMDTAQMSAMAEMQMESKQRTLDKVESKAEFLERTGAIAAGESKINAGYPERPKKKYKIAPVIPECTTPWHCRNQWKRIQDERHIAYLEPLDRAPRCEICGHPLGYKDPPRVPEKLPNVDTT